MHRRFIFLPFAFLLMYTLLLHAGLHAQVQARQPEPSDWTKRIEIGPIPGLTTVWHRAPKVSTVPLGTVVSLRVATPATNKVQWTGAMEARREGDWMIATVDLASAGRRTIQVRIHEGGTVTDESVQITARAMPAAKLEVTGITLSSAALDMSQSRVNQDTMRHFFGEDSIASVTTDAAGGYVTSIRKPVELTVERRDPDLATLTEWTADGAVLPVLGSPIVLAFDETGAHRIAAGAGAPESVQLTTYAAVLKSIATPNGTEHAHARELVFEATTDPPGYEDHVTWLASTKYGWGWPITATGARFHVTFHNTFSNPDRQTGLAFQWLGVRADDAVVLNHDTKMPDPPRGSIVCSTEAPSSLTTQIFGGTR